MDKPLSCENAIDLMGAYLADDFASFVEPPGYPTTTAVKDAFVNHVRDCPECHDMLVTLEITLRTDTDGDGPEGESKKEQARPRLHVKAASDVENEDEVSRLIQALTDPDEEVRRNAAFALSCIGPTALSADPDAYARGHAVLALARARDETDEVSPLTVAVSLVIGVALLCIALIASLRFLGLLIRHLSLH